MNNTRNTTCSVKNPRTNPNSGCIEPRVSYPQPNCNCFPKMESAKDMTLAMAYVPWQQYGNVFEPDKALQKGTLFPDLWKPYLGCKGGRCS